MAPPIIGRVSRGTGCTTSHSPPTVRQMIMFYLLRPQGHIYCQSTMQCGKRATCLNALPSEGQHLRR